MEKVLTDLKHLLEEELRKIVDKNDISPTELENATKAVCLMQKVQELEEWPSEEEMDEYYSRRGSYHGNSYRRGRDYDTGRYVSRNDGRTPNSYRHMDDMSHHSIKDRMIASLENMMDEAGSEYEQNQIHEWITRMEMGK